MQSNKVLQKLKHSEQITNKGIANGYAPLDENAKIPITYIPEGADTGGGNHTHDEYALKEHNHEDYSLKEHEHNNYSPIAHTHDEYSKSEHEHEDYSLKEETYSKTEVDELLENIETTPKDHEHEQYAKKVDIYDKTEIDEKLEDIKDSIGSGGSSEGDHTHDQYVTKDTIATEDKLGLVKIGSGLHINNEGALEVKCEGSGDIAKSYEILQGDWVYKVDIAEYYCTKRHDLGSDNLLMEFYDESNCRVTNVGVQLIDLDTIKLFSDTNSYLRMVLSSGGSNGGSVDGETGKFEQLTTDRLVIKDMTGDYVEFFVDENESIFVKPAYVKLGRNALGFSRIK